MISALINRIAPRRRAGAVVILAVVLGLTGCSGQDGMIGQMGTAKEKKPEERYRYEGTGKAKRKTLIRRQDERIKELQEKARNAG